MKTYGPSRSTTASPERVWSVRSDPNNWSRWNSGTLGDHKRSARLGATGTMETNRGSKHAVTFIDVEPPRHFPMTMSGPPLTIFSFICEVTPNAPGTRSRRASPSPGRSRSSSVR